MDGSTPAIHEYFKGKGSFNKTIQGIKNLQKYNLPVSTLFTLNKINLPNLIDTIKFNEELGIDSMSVMVVCPTGRSSSGELLINKENWYPIFLELSKLKKSNKIKLNFKIVSPNESDLFWLYYFPLKHYNKLDLLSVWNQPEFEKYSNKETREISCTAGISSCYIDSNGDIYGCELMCGINEFVAGNIKEKSLLKIWNESEVFNRFRNFDFENIQGKCKNCEHTWCGGGYRSSAFNLGGSYYSSDESCFYKK